MEQHLSKRATISEPIELELPQYTRWSSDRIRFEPAREKDLGKGIVFVDPFTEKELWVTPDTLQGYRDFFGARYDVLSDGNKAVYHVVEHVLSAIYCAGITDIRVVCAPKKAEDGPDRFSGYVPVVGPGIEPVAEPLREKRVENCAETPIFEITEKMAFTVEPNATLIVEPSDTFDIFIKTEHDDLADDLNAKPAEVMDVYQHLEAHKRARPIGRLQKKVLHMLWQVLRKTKVLTGLHPKAYNMAFPGMDGDDIADNMHPEYQAERNEHFYHTIYSDVLGLIQTHFPGQIKGRFTFINGKHTSRDPLMHQLAQSGVVTKKSRSLLDWESRRVPKSAAKTEIFPS